MRPAGLLDTLDRLLLPNAPETIRRQGALIRVRTYDHVVVVRVKGE